MHAMVGAGVSRCGAAAGAETDGYTTWGPTGRCMHVRHVILHYIEEPGTFGVGEVWAWAWLPGVRIHVRANEWMGVGVGVRVGVSVGLCLRPIQTELASPFLGLTGRHGPDLP